MNGPTQSDPFISQHQLRYRLAIYLCVCIPHKLIVQLHSLIPRPSSRYHSLLTRHTLHAFQHHSSSFSSPSPSRSHTYSAVHVGWDVATPPYSKRTQIGPAHHHTQCASHSRISHASSCDPRRHSDILYACIWTRVVARSWLVSWRSQQASCKGMRQSPYIATYSYLRAGRASSLQRVHCGGR